MSSPTSTLLGSTILAIALWHPSAGGAQARAFHTISGCRMQFVSDAPLERITGVSTTMSGDLTVDPANLGSVSGQVAVPVDSIHTGLDLRDEHLRSDAWLDAAHHPDAVLEITGIEGATALVADQVVRVTLRGRFSIHGRTHDISVPAQVRLVPASAELRAEGIEGDLIRAQASFSVSLPDYAVSVGPLVRLKVSDTIQVNVTIRLVG